MPAHNINFLIIDPDQRFQDFARQSVITLGYGRVAEVLNVRDALGVLATGIVDFVICDWSNTQGPEVGLLKLMKAQEVYRYIPFLFTARPQAGENERVKRAATAAVDGYLNKPCTLEQLKAAIDDILARYPSL